MVSRVLFLAILFAAVNANFSSAETVHIHFTCDLKYKSGQRSNSIELLFEDNKYELAIGDHIPKLIILSDGTMVRWQKGGENYIYLGNPTADTISKNSERKPSRSTLLFPATPDVSNRDWWKNITKKLHDNPSAVVSDQEKNEANIDLQNNPPPNPYIVEVLYEMDVFDLSLVQTIIYWEKGLNAHWQFMGYEGNRRDPSLSINVADHIKRIHTKPDLIDIASGECRVSKSDQLMAAIKRRSPEADVNTIPPQVWREILRGVTAGSVDAILDKLFGSQK